MSLSRWRLRVQMPTMIPTWERKGRLLERGWNSGEGEGQRRCDDDGGEDERCERSPSCLECVFHGACPSGRWVAGSPGRRGPRPLSRRPGSAPNALQDKRKRGSASRLDRLKVERAGLPFAGLSDVIGKALADCWRDVPIPPNSACFEGKIVPAGFLLNLAVAFDRVERLDRSKIFHREFLACHAPGWRRLLRGVKDGRRSDLAPGTVDCDW